jgi:putative sigma-54 modulation protein
MKFIISGKNITVTEGLKTAVQDKLSKGISLLTPKL